VEERFRLETRNLTRSWMQFDRDTLRDYLVRDVEDPRINVQSILSRHFLIELLTPGRFEELKDHELRFALAMNWLLKLARTSDNPEALDAALDALLAGDDEQPPETQPAVPAYLAEAFTALPAQADGAEIPNYVFDAVMARATEAGHSLLAQSVLATFQGIWRALLDGEEAPTISVLEPGCGSANDYRFLDAYGIARFLDYTGFDLCEKNVANAAEMFPDVRFQVGNALAIDIPDDAFDCAFVHDLFEHLSLEAMELAIGELCRVTRRSLCVSFFHMHEGARHVVRPVGYYHCNLLSAPATRDIFLRHAARVEAVHIDAFCRDRFNCPDTHNNKAYTFYVEK